MALVSVLIVCVFIPSLLAAEGYYWRSYTGDIPRDALEPGKDDNNEAIYIGMTLHPGWTLLPGTIYPSQKKVYYEFGSAEFSTDSDVLILCVEHKEQFRWVKTQKGRTVSEVTKNNELQMVLAGSDKSRPLYVGRTTIPRNQTVIGKDLVIDGVFNFMWLAQRGEGWSVTDYEVLLYDPRFLVKTECSGNNITVNIFNNQN